MGTSSRAQVGKGTDYRLGKKRPGSGILSRYSRSALMPKAMAATPMMKAPIMAVLAFQLAGWAYQPPAGDQTSLGYLDSKICQYPRRMRLSNQTYGIFPPPPIVNEMQLKGL